MQCLRGVAAAAACEKDRTGSSAGASSLSLSLPVTRSLFCSNRAVDPSRLEVTTGHRLNQSKPRFISLLPTRILSLLFLSLFLYPFLSLRISPSFPRLFFFISALSPSLYSFLSPRLSPSCLFQTWIIHRPRCQGTHGPELDKDRWCTRNW